MQKLLIIVSFFLLSNSAFAGNATGQISSIFVADDSTAVLFTLTSAIENTPRCNEGKRFSIELRKPGGMATYTAILEAKKQGFNVTVDGLNTCANEWKSEDLKNIKIH